MAVVGHHPEVRLTGSDEVSADSLWRAMQRHVLEERSYHVRYQLRVETDDGFRIQPGQCVEVLSRNVAPAAAPYRIILRKAGYYGDVLDVEGIEGGVSEADMKSHWWGPLDLMRTLPFPACHLVAKPHLCQHHISTVPMQLGEWLGELDEVWRFTPKPPPKFTYAVEVPKKGDHDAIEVYCPGRGEVLRLQYLDVPMGLDRGLEDEGWWRWYLHYIFKTAHNGERDDRPIHMVWKGDLDTTPVRDSEDFTDVEREVYMDPVGFHNFPKIDMDTSGHQWDSFVKGEKPIVRDSSNMFTPRRVKWLRL